MKRPSRYSRYKYSRWDGSQEIQLDDEQVFEALSESLLYHGNPSAALRELLNRGIDRKDAPAIMGIRELLDKIRAQRDQIFNQFDPSGTMSEVDKDLRDTIAEESLALENYLEAALSSTDKDRIASAKEFYMSHQVDLNAMGSGIGERIKALRQYDFVSPKAKAMFDKLTSELSRQLSEQYFSKAKENLSRFTLEDREKYRNMLASLNRLFQLRDQGADVTEAFQEFMSNYGDMFPSGIESFDDLIAFLVAAQEATELAFGALTDTERQELSSLLSNTFSDADLAWQLSQLMHSLKPYLNDRESLKGEFHGSTPMSPTSAKAILGDLDQLDALESYLRSVSNPDELLRLDYDQLRDLLGDDAASSIRTLGTSTNRLLESGLLDRTNDQLSISPKGIRKLGESALKEVFANLGFESFGMHDLSQPKLGIERSFETRKYEYGDPLDIAISETLRNTIVRQRGGLPLKISFEDFEIETKEASTRAATVLCLDLSLSMSLNGNFLSAKKVAVALHSLISSRFPSDYLGLVGFSEVATVIKPVDLPSVSWDYLYGTNIHDALRKARALLSRQKGTKQILLVTDGEPTAHIDESGSPYFRYPPDPSTLRATLEEAKRCTRAEITIHSFVLDANEHLRTFMNSLGKINHGRVYFVDSTDLGKHVMVDFVSKRRK